MISMRNVTLSNAISHNWILLNRPVGPRGIARGLSDPLAPSAPLASNPSRASCESLFLHSRRRGCKSDYEPRRGMGEYVKRIIKPLPRKSSSDDYIFEYFVKLVGEILLASCYKITLIRIFYILELKLTHYFFISLKYLLHNYLQKLLILAKLCS